MVGLPAHCMWADRWFVQLLVRARFLVNYVLVLVRACLLRLRIYMRTECTLFEPLVDVLLLFFYDFLNFILHPEAVSLQESRMAGYQVSLIVFYDGLEGALDVNLMFGQLVFFHKFLLGFSALIVKILPDRFQMILGGLMSAIRGRAISLCRRRPEFFLPVFLWGQHYLVIGLKVLLLIKIHCVYIFIMNWLLILTNCLLCKRKSTLTQKSIRFSLFFTYLIPSFYCFYIFVSFSFYVQVLTHMLGFFIFILSTKICQLIPFLLLANRYSVLKSRLYQ